MNPSAPTWRNELTYTPVLLIFALLLVGLNGFFVAAEFAIVRARVTRLDELIAQGNSAAEAAKKLYTELDAALSGTQLGITLASLGLGWLGEPAFANLVEPLIAAGPWSGLLAHSISVTVAFIIITLLHIVFGELAPKTMAIRNSERTLLLIARPMRLFHRLAYPMIALLNGAAGLSLRLAGIRVNEHELAHSQEELRLLLAQSQRSGLITPDEQQLVESVFNLADRSARQVMVPRSDIVYLRADQPYEDNLRIVRENQHTRYPLCEKDIDHVLGIVNLKDVLLRGEGIDLRELRREILFVPEMKSVKELLREFQRTHLHLAIVVDEYGCTAGVVALEDIVEELVGEIQDEFDLESPRFQKVDSKTYRMAGNFLLEELEDRLKLEIEDQENDTIGGYVMTRLGRPAKTGDIVQLGPYRLKVTRTRGFRILELMAMQTQDAVSDKPVEGD